MVNGNDELENGDFVQRRNSNDNKNVKFEWNVQLFYFST
jgi:hypothetical protein